MLSSEGIDDSEEDESFKDEIDELLEEGNDEPLTLEKEELADISADIDSKSSVVNEETPENKSTISESSEITDEDTKNHDVEQTQSKHEDETSEPSDNSDQESNPEDATNAINSDADSESIEDDIVVETEPQGTVHISAYNPGHSEPKTPSLGVISDSPIEVLHSIGDIHGWAPGLITYLISNKLAEIEINGFPLQEKLGKLHEENMNEIFPDPVKILQRNIHDPPFAGLCGQLDFDETGVNKEGHKAIKARWIAEPNVALVQVGDVYDRADHSELAAEILRQLMIDAPGRVFVLVGNHEQFMLEEDYDNWYFNEARNAFTDKEGRPNRNTRNHFRFLPTWANTATERAKATFERYVNSTWTLFLTQGAIMEKLGWIKPEIDLKPMLGDGWSGYVHAAKLKEEFGKAWSEKIPGALTALVIADTLFHHAEPSAHRSENGQGLDIPLHKTMTTVQSKTDNILFREYTHGQGSIKGSPDAPLLWSRGSSSGASSGNPAAESHLKDLAEAWQGLRRIVHGHTPTVGSGDFDSVTGGKSTTVSYLSENPNRQNSRGRANKIRVYNIDEGMSPPYYSGDDSIYSITRMPTGLRIETDEFSSLEANSSTDKLVKINPDHSIDIDSRDLWKWSENEWRISAKPNWGTSDDKFMYQIVEHGSWKGYISTKKSDESTRTLWDRNAGTTQVSKLMIQKAMSNFFSQNSVVVQEPRPVVLERITPIGIPLSRNNVKEAWSKIDVFLLLAKPNKKGGMSIIFINSTDKELDINVNNLFSKKMMKPRELTCKAKSYGIAMINNCEKIFISTNSKIIDDSRLEWVDGKNTIKPNTAPVIGYFSGVEKPHKKVEISNEKFVDLLTTLPKVESKKNKVSSNKLWESSRVRGTSLNSQGKGFTPPHQKQNQIIENSTEKILTHRPTQKMRTPTIKDQQERIQSLSNPVASKNKKQISLREQVTKLKSEASGRKGDYLGVPRRESKSENKEVILGKREGKISSDRVESNIREVENKNEKNDKKPSQQRAKLGEGAKKSNTESPNPKEKKSKKSRFDILYDGKLIKFSSELVATVDRIKGAKRIEIRFHEDGIVEIKIVTLGHYVLVGFKSEFKDNKFGKFKNQQYKNRDKKKIKSQFWSDIRHDEELLKIVSEHFVFWQKNRGD